jgi:hypothetical protein
MNKKKVLLLVGSPKAERSSSFSIGKYLCEKIEGKNFQTDHAFVHRLIMRKEKQEDLIRMIKKTNLIILSFPLYIDHLPSPVIRMMELLTNNKEELKAPERKAFLSICNSGFPESFQIKLATQICQNFSNAMGFQWKGGIQKGGGGLIHGSDLNEI